MPVRQEDFLVNLNALFLKVEKLLWTVLEYYVVYGAHGR